MTRVIGLTGGIGSGKSTVSQCLAELGAVILDADKVGHKILKSDTELWRKIVAAFGTRILTPSGDVDRKKLGEIVFR
ncbi:dephospho-CoA kinase, partial [Chloroflexota bacterium]